MCLRKLYALPAHTVRAGWVMLAAALLTNSITSGGMTLDDSSINDNLNAPVLWQASPSASAADIDSPAPDGATLMESELGVSESASAPAAPADAPAAAQIPLSDGAVIPNVPALPAALICGAVIFTLSTLRRFCRMAW